VLLDVLPIQTDLDSNRSGVISHCVSRGKSLNFSFSLFPSKYRIDLTKLLENSLREEGCQVPPSPSEASRPYGMAVSSGFRVNCPGSDAS